MKGIASAISLIILLGGFLLLLRLAMSLFGYKPGQQPPVPPGMRRRRNPDGSYELVVNDPP